MYKLYQCQVQLQQSRVCGLVEQEALSEGVGHAQAYIWSRATPGTSASIFIQLGLIEADALKSSHKAEYLYMYNKMVFLGLDQAYYRWLIYRYTITKTKSKLE